jgi:hypothetical protein
LISREEATRWLAAFQRAYPQFARWRDGHAALCERRRFIVIGKDMAHRVVALERLAAGHQSGWAT